MTKATASAAGKHKTRVPTIYLGCFVFDRPGERNHEGSFQVVVEATSASQAVERFEERLRVLHRSPMLFDGEPLTIYLDGIVELTGSLKGGVLVNVEESPSSPGPAYSITCTLPDQDGCGARSYGWNAQPAKDDAKNSEDSPFLDFGGKAFRRAVEKATSRTSAAGEPRRAESATKGGTAPSRAPGRSQPTERTVVPPDRGALALTLAEVEGTDGARGMAPRTKRARAPRS